jgi:hypothetical protein
MIRRPDTPPLNSGKKEANTLAPDPSDVIAFRRYTKQVWSKIAGRPICDDEADQILADFGRFLDVLVHGAMESGHE